MPMKLLAGVARIAQCFLDTLQPHNRGKSEVFMETENSQQRFTEAFKTEAVPQAGLPQQRIPH